jgi:hypothetical protein
MPGSHRFLRRKVEDEEFWLDLEAGRFYGLNETASAILDLWSRGTRTPAGLAKGLSERFEVSEQDALAAVEEFLPEARARGLLAE